MMLVQRDGKSEWLNYHHLYYFMVIAQEGSIALASAKLRLGQPTLSAQLKQFEDRLGVVLFERKHKRLILTETGRVALSYAQQIFKMGTEMLDALQDRAKPGKISVQIGALDSIPKELVLAVANRALASGDCSVSILEGKGDELLRELFHHRIDLFISNFAPAALSEGVSVHTRRVARRPVMIFGAPRFKALRKNFPRSLSEQPWVMPTAHSKLRGDLEHYLRLNEIRPVVVAETQDMAVLRLLAETGAGVVALPETPERPPQAGGLIPLGPATGVFEEFFLVAAARKIENPISSRLLKDFKA